MTQKKKTGLQHEGTDRIDDSSLLADEEMVRDEASDNSDSASVQAVNASERRASLEKDDAQADPMTLSGKADTLGRPLPSKSCCETTSHAPACFITSGFTTFVGVPAA
jgi:hypothetical protein